MNEIQEVYRLQGVNINDKHIEVISRQMMRWVRIEDVGDTEFLDRRADRQVPVPRGERAGDPGGRPSGDGAAALLGITKASLSTDSFISAASFQKRPRAHRSVDLRQIDHLRGLKGRSPWAA